MKAKLKKGKVVSKKIDCSLLILKWMDKREVMMQSTIHNEFRPEQHQMGRKTSSSMS